MEVPVAETPTARLSGSSLLVLGSGLLVLCLFAVLLVLGLGEAGLNVRMVLLGWGGVGLALDPTWNICRGTWKGAALRLVIVGGYCAGLAAGLLWYLAS